MTRTNTVNVFHKQQIGSTIDLTTPHRTTNLTSYFDRKKHLFTDVATGVMSLWRLHFARPRLVIFAASQCGSGNE